MISREFMSTTLQQDPMPIQKHLWEHNPKFVKTSDAVVMNIYDHDQSSTKENIHNILCDHKRFEKLAVGHHPYPCFSIHLRKGILLVNNVICWVITYANSVRPELGRVTEHKEHGHWL